jgi:hypothetical protein
VALTTVGVFTEQSVVSVLCLQKLTMSELVYHVYQLHEVVSPLPCPFVVSLELVASDKAES